MGVFINLKQNLLSKKIKKQRVNREIKIIPLEKYNSILLVLDASNQFQINKSHLELIFPSAKFSVLIIRQEKIDESHGLIYTFHNSDLGFGNLKSERLLGLLNTNYDALIDLTNSSSELDYFIFKSNSSLKIGNLNSMNNYLYDLLIEGGNSTSDFISNIEKHIILLSQDGTK